MVGISAFDYHIGDSFLHKLDVRFKLAILIAFNLSVAQASVTGLAGLSSISLLILIHLRVSIRQLFFEIRFFLILLLFVFAAQSFSAAGAPMFPDWENSVTVEGVYRGGITCWRLIHVVVIGLLFVRTSRPLEIKAGIFWYLDPIPGVSAHRISLMISLMFRFIPMVMEQYSEITEAQQSRGVELRKNPFFRLKVLVIPLMENAFQKADDMALAMEARCYSDKRTDPLLRSGVSDWIALVVSSVGCLLMVIG